MRRRSWIVLIIVVAVATAATLFFWPHDVTAVIHNQGPAAMLEVRVDVTGESYSLGDIFAGQIRSVQVRPIGESHIEIRYRIPDGNEQSLVVDCYLEPGYEGVIEAWISDGNVIKVEDKTVLPW